MAERPTIPCGSKVNSPPSPGSAGVVMRGEKENNHVASGEQQLAISDSEQRGEAEGDGNMSAESSEEAG